MLMVLVIMIIVLLLLIVIIVEGVGVDARDNGFVLFIVQPNERNVSDHHINYKSHQEI